MVLHAVEAGETVDAKRVGPTRRRRFTVFVDDNYHLGDETERYRAGTFDTWETAVEACEKILDAFLTEERTQALKSADGVLRRWIMLGDDPWIRPTPKGHEFSAREYLKRRVTELFPGSPLTSSD